MALCGVPTANCTWRFPSTRNPLPPERRFHPSPWKGHEGCAPRHRLRRPAGTALSARECLRTQTHRPGASGWNADLKHMKRFKTPYTVNWGLSTLHQGRSPITAPPSVLVSMVTMLSVAAAPLCTAQRDMNTDVESPVAWRHVCWLEDLHRSVCVFSGCVCMHACMWVCV